MWSNDKYQLPCANSTCKLTLIRPGYYETPFTSADLQYTKE